MRTTITLDADVVAALDDLRRSRHVGVSEAVNDLVRKGLRAPRERRPFVQRSVDLGLRIDVSNVAEALDDLDGPTAR